MAEWRVFLNGQNFWLEFEGKTRRLGFYTTRFVTADDAVSAELVAFGLLRGDPKLRACQNDRDDPPKIFVEEIAEVSKVDVDPVTAGYTFFEHEPDA